MGCGLDNCGFDFHHQQGIFFYLSSRTAPGSRLPSVLMDAAGVKGSEHEALPPSRADAKDDGAITLLCHACSQRGA